MRSRILPVILFCGSIAAGCGDDGDGNGTPTDPLIDSPGDLVAQGRGIVDDRYTAELWVRGTTAYTTTWGTRTVGGVQARGDAVKIWDVSATFPVLVDSLIISDVTTLGDIQATADGRYLIVATEPVGSIVIFDLANPRKPVLVTRFTNTEIANGVHTADVQEVGGKQYAFLCIDARGTDRARLVIVDISAPASPVVVFSSIMGGPSVHDVFVRDGILMAALWNDGVTLFDIGGGGRGGTVSNPVELGNVKTAGGNAHNIFWYRDPVTGSKKFAFVGEEGPGSIPSISRGDIHVLDVSDMSNPREVAVYSISGAGPHNFSADEERGILYAAYYNGGVRAINMRGDLGTCTASQKLPDGRCDLRKMNRELAKGPVGLSVPIYMWGVHFADGRLYASDMLNGLFRLSTVPAF